jgi:VanZ family protein
MTQDLLSPAEKTGAPRASQPKGRGARRLGFPAKAARPLAWISFLAIALLSLVPGNMRPHTLLPGQAEHFIAYAGAGFLLATGYRSRRERWAGWLGVTGASVVFELLQSFSPGRTPRVIDILASVAGLSIGLAFAAWALRERRRHAEDTQL